ncbi:MULTISPECIES: glycosyltransferase family 2 protein [Enorma]|uniref:glycosyltransferase family 2 protein n=1 Tax=Enorma TaxID=1472762 RepID=UPI000347AC1D|nr:MULTISPECIES: glycosyltransferase [Enorma]
MSDRPTPLVSVVVPICNVEAFLDQCLDSIEGQTLRDLEIICLNDGSSDASLDIVRRHAVRDNRIVVVDKENEGYGATCNRGIQLARGTWVAIVEPDDWIDAAMFADMVAFADSFDAGVDVVKTPWFEVAFWDNPDTMAERPCRLHRRMKTSSRPFALEDAPMLLETHPAIWSCLYRREFLLERDVRFIPYPGAGWADNPFLIDSLASARIVYLDRAYYHYRLELPKQAGSALSDERVAMPFERWMTMLDHMKERGLDSDKLLSAHCVRGFNYATLMGETVGWNHPVLLEHVRTMFSAMRGDLVLKHPMLSAKRKRFYFQVLGRPCPRIPRVGRMLYLMREVAFRATAAFGD